MAIFLLCLQAFVLYGISWVLWRLLRKAVTKSSLHDLAGPPRISLISGSMNQVYDPAGVPWHYEMIKKYGRAFKVHGLFGDEQVYVTDPLALHHILVKDQHIYEETSIFITENKLLFGDGLISTLGEHHKKQRRLISPAFSVVHLRNMVPMFYNIAHQMRRAMEKGIETDTKDVDIASWMGRTSLEFIGQGGLGYSFENWEEESPNPYSKAAKDLFSAVVGFSSFRQFVPFVVKLGSPSFRRYIVNHIPLTGIKKVISIISIMNKTSLDVFENKKEAFKKGNDVVSMQAGEGKDIMSILLKANVSADNKDKLPDHELLGQVNTFIFAAYDTTSSALCRIFHLMALHPEVQEKLRKEVLEARTEYGDMDHDTVMALPYLDSVIRESLRLYPPFIFSSRTTRKDIVLPLSKPIMSADGTKQITEIPLKNNTNVILSLGGVNRDPAIWGDDADIWKPERWFGRKVDDVAKEHLPGVYSGMMSFSGGPRACIGFTFALLEMKIVLSALLETLKFEQADEEIIWLNNTLVKPATKDGDATSRLPMKVSLLEKF